MTENNSENITNQIDSSSQNIDDSSIIQDLNDYLNQKFNISQVIKVFNLNDSESSTWDKLINTDQKTQLSEYEETYSSLFISLQKTNPSKAQELSILSKVEIELNNILDIFKHNKRKLDQTDESIQTKANKQRYFGNAMVIENHGNYLFSGLSNSTMHDSSVGDVIFSSVLPNAENPQVPTFANISPATIFPKSLYTRSSRRLVAPDMISLTHNCSFAPTYDSSKATMTVEEASIYNKPSSSKKIDCDILAYEGIDIQTILDEINKDVTVDSENDTIENLELPDIPQLPKPSQKPDDYLRIDTSVNIDDMITRNQLNLLKLQLLQKFRHKYKIPNPTKQEIEVAQEFCTYTSDLLLNHIQPKELSHPDTIQSTMKKIPHYDPSFQGTITKSDYAFFSNSYHSFAYPASSGREASHRAIRQFHHLEPVEQDPDELSQHPSNDEDDEELNGSQQSIPNGKSNGHLGN